MMLVQPTTVVHVIIPISSRGDRRHFHTLVGILSSRSTTTSRCMDKLLISNIDTDMCNATTIVKRDDITGLKIAI